MSVCLCLGGGLFISSGLFEAETESLVLERSLVLETESLVLETESCAGTGVLCCVLRKRRLETAIFRAGWAIVMEGTFLPVPSAASSRT